MQKLLQPYKLNPIEIIPGIVVLNDITVEVNTNFTLVDSIFKKYFSTKVTNSVVNLDISKFKDLKTLLALPMSTSIEDTAFAAIKVISDLYIVCIKNLTLEGTVQDLALSIKGDISSLPEDLFEMVKYINSRHLLMEISGSDTSFIYTKDSNIQFLSKSLGSSVKDNPINTCMRIKVLNRILLTLGINNLVDLTSLKDLFTPSDYYLNTACSPNFSLGEGGTPTTDISSFSVKCGRGHSQEDLTYSMLLGVEYQFNDTSYVDFSNLTLSIADANNFLRCDSNFLKNIDFISVPSQELNSIIVASKFRKNEITRSPKIYNSLKKGTKNSSFKTGKNYEKISNVNDMGKEFEEDSGKDLNN